MSALTVNKREAKTYTVFTSIITNMGFAGTKRIVSTQVPGEVVEVGGYRFLLFRNGKQKIWHVACLDLSGAVVISGKSKEQALANIKKTLAEADKDIINRQRLQAIEMLKNSTPLEAKEWFNYPLTK